MSKDISLCADNDCPMRETCYRWLLKPRDVDMASYFLPDREGDSCEYYMAVSAEDVGR